MSPPTHRARQHLETYGRRYPQAWRQLDEFRADRQQLGNWPETVFCPLAGAYAIITGGRAPATLAQMTDLEALGALAAWRPTQGIYRFDPDLYAALWASPLTDELPCALLRHLPAWGVYLELGAAEQAGGLLGFFAHLEYDPNDGNDELRLLIDMPDGFLPIPIPLGAWTLKAALEHMVQKAQRNATSLGMATPHMPSLDLVSIIASMVSLLLYLCCDEADYVRPRAPVVRQTKRGPRLFPPSQPLTWEVGVRPGAALRAARTAAAADAPATGTGTRPRGHMRRAHWHLFWAGPRQGDREARVKWLPPIPVNLTDPDAQPAVIHPVRAV